MAEPKQVYRIPPCHSFDIPAMESWLEDMASKGYILEKDSFFCGTATFEKGQPRKTRYRLEATNNPAGVFSANFDPEDDLVQLYRQMGWHYRGRRGQFYIFACEDPDVPELNTDPQIQAHTIQALAKFQRSKVMGGVFNVLFLGWLQLSQLFFSGMVTIGTWTVLLFLGLFTTDFVRNLVTVFQLSKLKKQLQNGDPMEHKSDYVNCAAPYFVSKILRTSLWILTICLMFYNMSCTNQMVPLDSVSDPFPFATLQEIYPNAEVTPWDSYRENQVAIWSDTLAPECYEYYESSYVGLPGEPKETMWLSVLYFDTRWDWTARAIARELVYQAGASPLHRFFDELFGDEPVILTELEIEGADYAACYYRYRNFPYIVIQKGSAVIRVNLDIFGDTAPMEPEVLGQIMADSLN